MYKNIKDCVVGRKYRFDEHYHEVCSEDVNLSYMTGECVVNEKRPDRHVIEIRMHLDVAELKGEYQNRAIFHFPHDHQYENVKVSEYEGI